MNICLAIVLAAMLETQIDTMNTYDLNMAMQNTFTQPSFNFTFMNFTCKTIISNILFIQYNIDPKTFQDISDIDDINL